MRATCLTTLAAGLCLATLSRSWADEPSPSVRVARLIRGLGSDSYAERQQANDELARIGPEARPELESAARSADPEVRLRARQLLDHLKARDIWEPPAISCRVQNQPARVVLDDIAARTGNQLGFGANSDRLGNANLTLDVPADSYWNLIDAVCRKTGSHVGNFTTANRGNSGGTSPPQLLIVEGKSRSLAAANCGALKAEVTAVAIERTEFQDARSGRTRARPALRVSLRLMWEERLRLAAYRSSPGSVEARTDTHFTLRPIETESHWVSLGPDRREATAVVLAQPPFGVVERLEDLKIKWRLLAVGEMASIDVGDLSVREPFFQDDVELSLSGFEPSGPGHWDVNLELVREAGPGDSAPVSAEEYRIELVDEAQKPLAIERQEIARTGAGGIGFKLTFASLDQSGEPKKLKVTYPRIRAEREVEIVFHDVSLAGQW